MDVDNSATTKCSEDRLSSLPDDILIRIISRLPFPYVVVTAHLSTRWRGLWTHLTSINITRLIPMASLEFFTIIDHLLSRITSPCLNSFSVKLGYNQANKRSIDSWIESLTNNRNNVRKLKLRLPFFMGISVTVLHRFILQTQTTLVLLECTRLFDSQLPSDVEFNFPNLRNLSLGFQSAKSTNEWLKKLIKACPLLVELTLSCVGDTTSATEIECSNQNLRRLVLDNQMSGRDHNVVINAPKLKYLTVSGKKYPTFCFDKEPTALREARITVSHYGGASSDKVNKLWSAIYKGVSSAKVLVLDATHIQHLSTVFRFVTRLTIDVRDPVNIETALCLRKLCPVLNFLTLRFYIFYRDDERRQVPKPLQILLRRLHIEIYTDPYFKPFNNFEVVEYLLSNAINLAHVKYDLTNSQNWNNEAVHVLQKNELELCKRLYSCPIASKVCEIEFIGKTFKMSQKVGPEAWRENDIVNPFIRCAPEKRFTFLRRINQYLL